MKTEVELPTGTAVINKWSKGSSIQIGDFKASITELRIMEMTKRGLTNTQMAEDIGIKPNSISPVTIGLQEKNTLDSHDQRPSLNSLIEEADRHELLTRVAITGLQATADRLTNRSEENSGFFPYPKDDLLIAYARDYFEKEADRLLNPKNPSLVEIVLHILHGNFVPNSEIAQKGLDPLLVRKEIFSIREGFFYFARRSRGHYRRS